MAIHRCRVLVTEEGIDWNGWLSYLSPSSLSRATKEPFTFLLQKMGYKYDPQSQPAAVGTAFDILIKKRLCSKGIPLMSKDVGELEDSLEGHHEFAYGEAEKCMLVYDKAGLINATKWVELESHSCKPLEGCELELLGQEDACIVDARTGLKVPLDWKVMGSCSKSGVSPNKLYLDLFDGERWRGAHKDYFFDIPFEKIHESWAKQLCIYGWLRGLGIVSEGGGAFPAYIHQVFYHGVGRDIKVAVFRGVLSVAFQKELLSTIQITSRKLVSTGQWFESLQIPARVIRGEGFINLRKYLECRASTESFF